jgi:flagellar biosynthesis protein FlhB
VPKPEQTEKATPKRRQEARQRGQVPRSQELAGAVIFLASVFAVHAFQAATLARMRGSVAGALQRAGEHGDPTIHSVWLLFAQSGSGIGMALLALFGVAMLAGIGANVLQFGFVFTLKPITPNPAKLNPLNGFTRRPDSARRYESGRRSARTHYADSPPCSTRSRHRRTADSRA